VVLAAELLAVELPAVGLPAVESLVVVLLAGLPLEHTR
jgi:hypothetical protein